MSKHLKLSVISPRTRYFGLPEEEKYDRCGKDPLFSLSVPASAGLSYASVHPLQDGKKNADSISCQAVVTC